jgi:diguanylate cyclase (GGDEF)-like protein/PAS domain S-box-containing protein
MDNETSSQISENDGNVKEAILAEQVRQAYSLSPIGQIATIINSAIVFFLMYSAISHPVTVIWFIMIMLVTVLRIAMVLRYRRIEPEPAAARIWGNRFIAGLALIGIVWGSISFFPLSKVSLVHQVFIAFVLGGMAAGAAATFSALKHGYLAYAIPAMAPLAIRFLLADGVILFSMGGMLIFYGLLLWGVSRQNFNVNRTSLLLRFENKAMIKSLNSSREELLMEIEARLKAEAGLRVQQDLLEKTVEERTSDLTRANQRLKVEVKERKQSEDRLAVAQKAGGVGVFDVDFINSTIVWTGQMEELFGLSPGSFEGNYVSWAKRIYPDDLPELEAHFRKWVQERREQVKLEYKCVRADGQMRWMAVTAQFSYLADGKPSRIIGTNVDITERKKLEDTIIHLAQHDPLTGLPNRRLFRDMISHEFAQARRNRRKVALMFLDLDRFKEINDTFGHETGDELLKEVSKRLKANIRQSDAAARIGGDEFNIILADIARLRDIMLISRKIMDSFKRPFTAGGHEFNITASIGISIYPDDSDQIDALYRYADIAMYHAKDMGRNNFQFYNPDINLRSVERIRTESMLRRSIELGELAVYYQPQVNISSTKIVCAEALVRWKHPEMGILEPGSFISAAEDTGFIAVIDEYVLRTACAQARLWRDAGLPAVCFTVNLSARGFQNPELIGNIARIMENTGAPPGCLHIEITESLAMSDIDRTIERLTELADMGVHAYIDDFGMGCSSLNYLKRLPIQKLKIDKSFIKDLAVNSDDRGIVMAVTAMAHTMSMSVVAEGVETKEQLSFLRSNACDEAQGYLFGKAMSPEEFGKLLARNGEAATG